MTRSWRVAAVIAVAAILGWVGFEIGRAGSDIQVLRTPQSSTLTAGRVSGKRVDGRAWSLDYDKVSMSPDGSLATIAHVRDGRLHRTGKPDVTMTGDNVTVNTATNDITVGGPVSFREPLAAQRVRTFRTNGARYIGATRVLILEHPSTITDDGATVAVASATIDFRTGDVKLGRIEGTRPGSAP